MEGKNKHTNKQEQQTFAANYELWFSRGGTALHILSGPPPIDTGEY